MSGVVFVDSNVLIYAHDRDAGPKRAIARELTERLWNERTGCLSVQVLQEFFVTVTRKLRSPVARAQAREVVRAYSPWVLAPTTAETVLRATEIGASAELDFWDALIIAAAEQSGAAVLYSEDLNHGQTVAGIRITNPFR
jgi:predicted nucleic acid-binding protein